MKGDIVNWLKEFQERVNKLAESNHLIFTAVVWGQDRDDKTESWDVTVAKTKSFPYLDMEMYWENQELRFRVHLKPNHLLKYLNKGSAHTNACFESIPHGVMGRLAKLTSRTEVTEDMRIDELYPRHAEALRKAKLAPEVFPKLGEKLDDLKSESENRDRNEQDIEKNKAENARQSIRQSYFCIGFSKFWSKPIHAILKELKDKHGQNWLRISMSYHKFSNLRGIFQGDLSRKLSKGIKSRDFMDEKCNCNAKSKVDGLCMWRGRCRNKVVVYQVTCKVCKSCDGIGKTYIGNTQGNAKGRLMTHLSETKRLANGGKKSDSFAAHFVGHISEEKKKDESTTIPELREMMEVDILWQGDGIRCSKSFGRADCNLCMKERTEILKLKKKNPKGLINSNNEFYGACRHKTKFHRYITANTLSTDEAINAEKSNDYLNSTYGDSEIMKEKDLLVYGVCRPALLNV